MPVLLNQPGVGPERALPSYWCRPSVIGLTLRHEAVGIVEFTPLCRDPGVMFAAPKSAHAGNCMDAVV